MKLFFLVFKEVTLKIGKISSNINPPLESNIKNKLEMKLRPQHNNYNINHNIKDEDNDIPKQIKRAGK